jgi:hypothetical protein
VSNSNPASSRDKAWIDKIKAKIEVVAHFCSGKYVNNDLKSTCCFKDKTGIRKGNDASQKFMAPSLCPVMYKFLTFENPLNRAEFPSFCLVSEGRSGGIFLPITS